MDDYRASQLHVLWHYITNNRDFQQSFTKQFPAATRTGRENGSEAFRAFLPHEGGGVAGRGQFLTFFIRIFFSTQMSNVGVLAKIRNVYPVWNQINVMRKYSMKHPRKIIIRGGAAWKRDRTDPPAGRHGQGYVAVRFFYVASSIFWYGDIWAPVALRMNIGATSL